MVGAKMSKHTTAVQRFWCRVTPINNTECWFWQGPHGGDGYGQLWLRKKGNVRAHRFAYELANGKIPEDLQIDHLCRNSSCVNPSHLEAVSSRTNTLRGEGHTARNAKKTHCIHGHAFTKENTYYKPKGKGNWRACRSCARAQNRNWRKARNK